MKESVVWSVIWLACGLSFTAFVYYAYQGNWLGLGLNTPVYLGGAIVLGTLAVATVLSILMPAKTESETG